MGILIPEKDVVITSIRAQGAGGQNVNKVSSAVHLRFDIRNSSLPVEHQDRLLALSDQRITREGILVIKAQAHRSRLLNRAEALERLQELVDSVALPPKRRKATRPTAASRRRRLEAKTQRSEVKASRGSISD